MSDATKKSADLLNPKELHLFGNLDLLARQVVEGFITGLHKSPFHGFSVEFAEHRLYNTGESTRHIDWKLYARTDRLYTKRYEEETNLRCHLLLDTSSSMLFPDKDYNKLRFSIYAAASLAYQLRQQRDAVGINTFTEKVQEGLSARSNAVHYRQIISKLESLLAFYEKGQKGSTAETFHLVAEMLHRRSLVIIFSDLFDDPEEEEAIYEALRHLKYNKHEVIFFHTVDKDKELDFNFDDKPYEFIDLESDESIKLFPEEIKKAYQEKIKDQKVRLKTKCNQFKVDYIEADINKGLRQVLLAYMVKRNRMM